jgi:glycosyltransferase involved in cell wall biosynthesis
MRVAVAIPAYDAAFAVGDVVRRALATGGPVLVVDDGSADGTAEAARVAGARVVVHPRNLGKGRALATAFEDLFEAGYDAVVTLDADGQHSPEEIPRLVAAARTGAGLVLGTRRHLFGAMSRVRRASNTLSSWAISKIAGVDVADAQTGFRLYTRRLIETTGFPEPRFEAESAVLVRAARAGFTIAMVPVGLDVVDGRATSHYRPLVDSLRIAGAVTRARLASPPRRYDALSIPGGGAQSRRKWQV